MSIYSPISDFGSSSYNQYCHYPGLRRGSFATTQTIRNILTNGTNLLSGSQRVRSDRRVFPTYGSNQLNDAMASRWAKWLDYAGHGDEIMCNCPPGHWKIKVRGLHHQGDHWASCVPCEEGSGSTQNNHRNSTCGRGCNPGYFRETYDPAHPDTGCRRCPINTYTDVKNGQNSTSSCSTCPAGSISYDCEDSKVRTPVSQNTSYPFQFWKEINEIKDTGCKKCVPCPAGKYYQHKKTFSFWTGATRANRGNANSAKNSCSTCATYSNNLNVNFTSFTSPEHTGQTGCYDCDNTFPGHNNIGGRYYNRSGIYGDSVRFTNLTDQCKKCVAGTYLDQAGSGRDRRLGPGGDVSLPNSWQASRQCSVCPAGSVAQTAGNKQTELNNAWSRCWPNSSFCGGRGTSVNTSDNNYRVRGGEKRICNGQPGLWCESSRRQANGKPVNSGFLACSSDGAHTFSSHSDSKCTLLPERDEPDDWTTRWNYTHHTLNTGITDTQKRDDVKTIMAPGAKSCVACGPGKFSPHSSIECQDCLPGTYSSGNGNSQCTICPPGQYQPSPGKTSCITCPAGNKVTSNSNNNKRARCDPCPANKYSPQFAGGPVADDQCFECPAGTEMNSTNDGCNKCTGFKINPTPGNRCDITCPSGQQPNENHTRCDTCPVGEIATGNRCVKCPAGTKKISETLCTPCPIGQTSSRGSGNCFDCPKGTYNTKIASPTCERCPNDRWTIPGAKGAGINQDLDISTCKLGDIRMAPGTTPEYVWDTDYGKSHDDTSAIGTDPPQNVVKIHPQVYIGNDIGDVRVLPGTEPKNALDSSNELGVIIHPQVYIDEPKTGDVRIKPSVPITGDSSGDIIHPQVYISQKGSSEGGAWRSIWKTNFDNNNHGVEKICKQLGYTGGVISNPPAGFSHSCGSLQSSDKGEEGGCFPIGRCFAALSTQERITNSCQKGTNSDLLCGNCDEKPVYDSLLGDSNSPVRGQFITWRNANTTTRGDNANNAAIIKCTGGDSVTRKKDDVNKKWMSIWKTNFKDHDNGSNKICQQLGYSGGEYHRTAKCRDGCYPIGDCKKSFEYCDQPNNWCRGAGAVNIPRTCGGIKGNWCQDDNGSRGFRSCSGTTPFGTWPRARCPSTHAFPDKLSECKGGGRKYYNKYDSNITNEAALIKCKGGGNLGVISNKMGDLRISPDTSPQPTPGGFIIHPEVYGDNKWEPICNAGFWGNNNGANIACKLLGYNSGELAYGTYNADHRNNDPYPTSSTARAIGQCDSSDETTMLNNGKLGRCKQFRDQTGTPDSITAAWGCNDKVADARTAVLKCYGKESTNISYPRIGDIRVNPRTTPNTSGHETTIFPQVFVPSSSSSNPQSGDIRIKPGSNPSRLNTGQTLIHPQIYKNGSWGSIYRGGIGTNPNTHPSGNYASDLICKNLGYESGRIEWPPTLMSDSTQHSAGECISQPSPPPTLNILQACNGSAQQSANSSQQQPNHGFRVLCSNLRRTGSNGNWRSIWRHNFHANHNGGDKICKQLGYIGGYTDSSGSAPIRDCTESGGCQKIGECPNPIQDTDRITDCRGNGRDNSLGSGSNALSVKCYENHGLGEQGKMGPRKDSNPSKGWKSIYRNFFWDSASPGSDIICKQLGFNGGYARNDSLRGSRKCIGGCESTGRCGSNHQRITDCRGLGRNVTRGYRNYLMNGHNDATIIRCKTGNIQIDPSTTPEPFIDSYRPDFNTLYLPHSNKKCDGLRFQWRSWSRQLGELRDGTPYAWEPPNGDISICLEKCLNDPLCGSVSVDKSNNSKPKCEWRQPSNQNSLTDNNSHTCYIMKNGVSSDLHKRCLSDGKWYSSSVTGAEDENCSGYRKCESDSTLFTNACPDSGGEGDKRTDGNVITPLLRDGNSWKPICNAGFWHNNNGANIACKILGYERGEMAHGVYNAANRNNDPYPKAPTAKAIGQCDSSDETTMVNSGELGRCKQFRDQTGGDDAITTSWGCNGSPGPPSIAKLRCYGGKRQTCIEKDKRCLNISQNKMKSWNKFFNNTKSMIDSDGKSKMNQNKLKNMALWGIRDDNGLSFKPYKESYEYRNCEAEDANNIVIPDSSPAPNIGSSTTHHKYTDAADAASPTNRDEDCCLHVNKDTFTENNKGGGLSDKVRPNTINQGRKFLGSGVMDVPLYGRSDPMPRRPHTRNKYSNVINSQYNKCFKCKCVDGIGEGPKYCRGEGFNQCKSGGCKPGWNIAEPALMPSASPPPELICPPTSPCSTTNPQAIVTHKPRICGGVPGWWCEIDNQRGFKECPGYISPINSAWNNGVCSSTEPLVMKAREKIGIINKCLPYGVNQYEESTGGCSNGIDVTPQASKKRDNDCASCNPGYIKVNGSRTGAPRFQDPRGTICIPSTPGYYSLGGTISSSTECPEGNYSGKAASTCKPCPRGTFSNRSIGKGIHCVLPKWGMKTSECINDRSTPGRIACTSATPINCRCVDHRGNVNGTPNPHNPEKPCFFKYNNTPLLKSPWSNNHGKDSTPNHRNNDFIIDENDIEDVTKKNLLRQFDDHTLSPTTKRISCNTCNSGTLIKISSPNSYFREAEIKCERKTCNCKNLEYGNSDGSRDDVGCVELIVDTGSPCYNKNKQNCENTTPERSCVYHNDQCKKCEKSKYADSKNNCGGDTSNRSGPLTEKEQIYCEYCFPNTKHWLNGTKCQPHRSCSGRERAVRRGTQITDTVCGPGSGTCGRNKWLSRAGTNMEERTCEYIGICRNGKLIDPRIQTQKNHCASCDKGYHLCKGTTKERGGDCYLASTWGEPVPPTEENKDEARRWTDGKNCVQNRCFCSNGKTVTPRNQGSNDPNNVIASTQCRIHNSEVCSYCNPGYYLVRNEKTSEAKCLKWTVCNRNQWVKKEGTGTSNRECGNCPIKTFNPLHNSSTNDNNVVKPMEKSCKCSSGTNINVKKAGKVIDIKCSCLNGRLHRVEAGEPDCVCNAGFYGGGKRKQVDFKNINTYKPYSPCMKKINCKCSNGTIATNVPCNQRKLQTIISDRVTNTSDYGECPIVNTSGKKWSPSLGSLSDPKNAGYKISTRKCPKEGQILCESCMNGFVFNKRKIKQKDGSFIPINTTCVLPTDVNAKPATKSPQPIISTDTMTKGVTTRTLRRVPYKTTSSNDGSATSNRYNYMIQSNRR